METLQIAQEFVGRFNQSDCSIVNASNEAGRCHSLESKIKIGIKAALWIFTTSEVLREVYVEEIELKLPDGETLDFNRLSKEIQSLYEWWLLPCDSVEQSINEFESKGFTISPKEEYFNCKKRIEQKIRSYGLREQAVAAYEEGYFDGELVD